MTKLERLQKAVVDANAAGDAAWADPNDNDADAAWENAYFKSLNEAKKEQDNAVNAAYDTLRKSVLGRDYKLERGK